MDCWPGRCRPWSRPRRVRRRTRPSDTTRTTPTSRDPVRRTDWLDPIKHISLGRPGWYLSLGGELRERFEFFENTDWKPAPADGFLLQKYMLPPSSIWARASGSSRNFKSGLEDGRTGGPRPTDEDRLDLHEAFVDVALDDGHAAALRLGRREMAFGSQRLVSVRAGPNVRQSFDGVSVLVAPGAWRLEAFATKPAKTDAGVFDDDPDHARTFWGVYATGPLRLFTQAGIDLYYLGLDRKRGSLRAGHGSRASRHGGRRGSGDAQRPGTTTSRSSTSGDASGLGPIRAWTFASDTGLTLADSAWRPRFGLKADVTSGDGDPEPSRRSRASTRSSRAASYFGENQLIGPVNHIDLHPSIDLHPFQARDREPLVGLLLAPEPAGRRLRSAGQPGSPRQRGARPDTSGSQPAMHGDGRAGPPPLHRGGLGVLHRGSVPAGVGLRPQRDATWRAG